MGSTRHLKALLAGVLGASWCMAQDVLYHAIRLPPIPGAQVLCNDPEDVNQLGQVAGMACGAPRGATPYRWDPPATIIALTPPAPNSLDSSGDAINNLGHVVGRRHGTLPDPAFWWSPETGIVVIRAADGEIDPNTADGINDQDQVVGGGEYERNGQTVGKAYLWHPTDGIIGLGDLPGGSFFSSATDINNAGQVTGQSSSARASWGEAFIWDAESGMRALGDLPGGGYMSTGRAINDLGQICGTGGGGALFWDPQAGLSRLPEPPVTFMSFAFGLNDHGEVVGRIDPTRLPGGEHAVLWDAEHNIHRIDDLLDAASLAEFAPIHQGKGINNAGWIIANTHAGGSVLIPFLLSDLNCDGLVDFVDLEALLLYLTDPRADPLPYAGCRADWAADVNQDAVVDIADAWALHALLTREPQPGRLIFP